MAEMPFDAIRDRGEGAEQSVALLEASDRSYVFINAIDAANLMRDAPFDRRNLRKRAGSEDPDSMHSAKGLDPRRLQRVLGYIDDHLADAITLETMADIACLSTYHFARAFKAAVGLPPHHYVCDRRLRYAAMLLTGSGQTLARISLACGFSSQGSFSRAFHRATGVTPGRYCLAATGSHRVCGDGNKA